MKKICLLLLSLMVLCSSAVAAAAGDAPKDTASTAPDTAVRTEEGGDDDFLDAFEDGSEGEQAVRVDDPLYPVNYIMYSINDVMYTYALRPVALGYRAIMPEPARNGIRNFFHNLLFPVRFVNNVLQGKVDKAGNEVGVFLLNSTAGILGFNRFAQEQMDMHTQDEDLGQTFGTWTIGEGFYLYLPLLGPTTLRDAVGRVGDYFITPVNYASPWELEWGLTITDTTNSLSLHVDDIDALKKASVDPYVAFRNAYIQKRRKAIED